MIPFMLKRRQFFRFCHCTKAAIFNTLDQNKTKPKIRVRLGAMVFRIQFSCRELTRLQTHKIFMYKLPSPCLTHLSHVKLLNRQGHIMSMMDICKSSNEIYVIFLLPSFRHKMLSLLFLYILYCCGCPRNTKSQTKTSSPLDKRII